MDKEGPSLIKYSELSSSKYLWNNIYCNTKPKNLLNREGVSTHYESSVHNIVG